jgi:hypothetical protein
MRVASFIPGHFTPGESCPLFPMKKRQGRRGWKSELLLTFYAGKKDGILERVFDREHVKIFNKTTNANTSHLKFSCVSS